MTADGVDVVRRCYEAFDSGDLDAALACLHEDVEWDTTLLIDGSVIRGRDNVGTFWAALWESFPFHHEDVTYTDAGERVLVLATIVGRGVGSGIEIGGPCAYVWRVGAGYATHVRFYPEAKIGLAREEAGLTEPAV